MDFKLSIALSKEEELAVRQAAVWYATLAADDVSQADHDAWQKWYVANPFHQKAWEQMEAIRAEFSRVQGNIAMPVLSAASNSRRTILKSLVLALITGSAAWTSYRLAPWEEWLAEYRTAIGERREITLADGSSLSINTKTSLDAIFDTDQRLLKLHSGDILIKTAADPNKTSRPFLVETKHGRVLALGTRFSVRAEDHLTSVSVFEKSVKIMPNVAQHDAITVNAGQQIGFSSAGIGIIERYNPLSISWKTGSITVVDATLESLINEISRYRSGLLFCDARVAHLRISGTFPIDDTDRALKALENVLPISILSRTRYWVTILPKQV
jgi:transmembrane sensor